MINNIKIYYTNTNTNTKIKKTKARPRLLARASKVNPDQQDHHQIQYKQYKYNNTHNPGCPTVKQDKSKTLLLARQQSKLRSPGSLSIEWRNTLQINKHNIAINNTNNGN